jgi:UDP-N-acetylglucosamine--N-acetylmuramyl-(pentapeptide) pyrophosphoryl-undecaprenol N-acetylglucosamine transferase
MGGFTSTAPIIAARAKRIPSFVHESNAIPGRANKLAARFTNTVLLGFKECQKFFPRSECQVTGTPVRANLGSRLDRAFAIRGFGLDPSKPVLLVTGGSQGAGGINQILFRCAPFFATSGFQIIHLTGKNDDRLAAANYQREGIPHFVAPFHHRMEEAYSVADLVISRAGASSLGELARFGLPSILIPYPYATDDHQRANAEIFSTAGAAILSPEGEVVPEIFAATVSNLLGDGTRRSEMAKQARTLNPADAAEKVAEILEKAAEKEDS